MVKYQLSDFKENPDVFPDVTLLATVKSFNLREIRNRYNESRKRGKAGSIERRPPAVGGLVRLDIRNGTNNYQNILGKYTEARGIAFHQGQLAISSEDKILIFSETSPEPIIIQNPWFSYIHTVRWNSDNSALLVASSGVDTIQEVSIPNGEILWEWVAWEHGLNQGENPATGQKHFLTRDPEKADILRDSGEHVLVITNPKADTLPTALRAAFINSAEYDGKQRILATLFHEGKVIAIEKNTGEFQTVIDGLTRPHGGLKFCKSYLVTDTAGGRVIRKDETQSHEYVFTGLSGKHESVRDLEWLQTSHPYGNYLITIDSNRSAFIFYQLEQQSKLTIHFEPEWAVQDFVIADSISAELLTHVTGWFKTNKIEE